MEFSVARLVGEHIHSGTLCQQAGRNLVGSGACKVAAHHATLTTPSRTPFSPAGLADGLNEGQIRAGNNAKIEISQIRIKYGQENKKAKQGTIC